MSRAVESLLDRLGEQASEIARYRKHLDAQRKRRDVLIRKLLYLGVSERTISQRAGVAFSRVHQIKKASKEGNE